MTFIRYLLWFGLALLWFAVISVVQLPIRKRCGIVVRLILIVVKVLLGTALAYALMAVESDISYQLGFDFAPLYVVLMADAVGDIISLPFVMIKRRKKRDQNPMQITVCAVCMVIYLVFGTVNMQTVTANRFTVTSDKISQDYHFVFLCDLHVGSSQSMRTVEETIRKVDEEDADFVLLGGDIVDEFTTKDEMVETFSLLGAIKAPVYYVYGNHDRQPNDSVKGKLSFTEEELETAILSNGIQILRDEWVSFSKELVLFGREDYSREERKLLIAVQKRPDNAFIISVDHSPYSTEDIADSGADLQLSGHSLAGQLFPLQYLYRLAGYDAYGFFRHGNTDLYVSSGAGGWCFPFRSESGCHYECFTLEPAR